MEKSIAQFLEFNGKRINVLTADGHWWVAIKPVCEALNIEYTRIFKNLKEDDFFADALAKQPTHDTLGRLQEMVCIRERDVYGWLCSIRSESPELAVYKRKCYDILYQYFHAPLTGRMTTLTEKSAIDIEIEELEHKMTESEEYKKIQELKKRKTVINAKLRQMDKELVAGQLSLAF